MVAMGIIFVYVGPTWNGSIATTKAAISADDDALSTAQAFAEQEAELTMEQNNILPENLKRLSVFLPDSVDNVRLILDLNSLAAKSSVSLSNIDVSSNRANGKNNTNTTSIGNLPTSASNPIDSADLSLTVVGTYSSFQEFLAGIERSARLLNVREISVDGSDTGVYKYEMKIRFYWLH